MTRQQRRAEERKAKKKATYNIQFDELRRITQQEIEAQTENIRNEAINTIDDMIMIVLHKKFGFGKKRLQRYREGMVEISEMIQNKEIDLKKEVQKIIGTS